MERRRRMVLAMVLGLSGLDPALAQIAGETDPNPSPASARIQVVPVELTEPGRYRFPLVLEPIRRVSLRATEDGIVRSVSVRVGDTVRDNQEIAQLDRGVALAHLRLAEADVKAAEAASLAADGGTPVQKARAAAELEAAQARAELARIALDRCTQRAPFAGKILELPVDPVQFVAKGTVVAELADVSRLRVLMPVPKSAVQPGESLGFDGDNARARGRVLSVIPLPERFAALRELATPWVAAWVEVTPAESEPYEAGQAVRNPYLPTEPIAVVPAQAVQQSGQTLVQVLREERVADIPVQILGTVGPERTQVSGSFQPDDRLIVGSSVVLAQGTYIRFEGGAVGSQTPKLPGSTEGVGEPPPARANNVAPIGTGGSGASAPPGARPSAAFPRAPQTPTVPTQPPSRPAAPRGPAVPPGSVPF